MVHDQHVHFIWHVFVIFIFYALPRSSFVYIWSGFIPSAVWRFSIGKTSYMHVLGVAVAFWLIEQIYGWGYSPSTSITPMPLTQNVRGIGFDPQRGSILFSHISEMFNRVNCKIYFQSISMFKCLSVCLFLHLYNCYYICMSACTFMHVYLYFVLLVAFFLVGLLKDSNCLGTFGTPLL